MSSNGNPRKDTIASGVIVMVLCFCAAVGFGLASREWIVFAVFAAAGLLSYSVFAASAAHHPRQPPSAAMHPRQPLAPPR